jgi:hypothetical protein
MKRTSNPSVERTHNGGARLLVPPPSAAPLCAAHVKRRRMLALCMKSLLLHLVALFLCASAQAQGYGKTIYISPDGKFRAEIVPTYTQERGFHEHCVTIYTRTGKQLAQNDHSSNDHEHGQTVNQAEWTPDSRFFVYGTHSSGGHSGWHFPT